MHTLLDAQIRQHLPGGVEPRYQAFVESVEKVYREFEHGHHFLERSLALVSSEMSSRTADLSADLSQREQIEQELRHANSELREINRQLEATQHQLLQADKMASIGQLAAGVAHEINNPIGYVSSNLQTLDQYLQSIFELVAGYEAIASESDESLGARMRQLKTESDYEYIRQDIESLLSESKDGIIRVKQIVQDLKDFSRIDAGDEFQIADIHRGLDSTLNIVHNEIKYKAEIIKDYGDIPVIDCLASQMNQVFMNMLVNAGHAISGFGKIWIRTFRSGNEVCVQIEDTGEGIAPENLKRIFDPFFTTKEVGKGTGLGLALSYGIVQKHSGRIEVSSTPGVGSCFSIFLPVTHLDAAPASR